MDYAELKSLRKTAERNGITDGTVSTYIKLELSALEKKLDSECTKFDGDKCSNLIYKMLLDNHNISDIMKYLKYTGAEFNPDKLKPFIKRICERYFNRNMINKKTLKRNLLKDAVKITRLEIVKYLTTIRTKKNTKVRKHWQLLRNAFPVLREVEQTYRHFNNCLNEPTATQIDKFIETTKLSKIPKLKNFANGLTQDLAAIKEGIRTQITSGFVEGGNNKIKLIKRLGYGRMKFPRLKQKILTYGKFF